MICGSPRTTIRLSLPPGVVLVDRCLEHDGAIAQCCAIDLHSEHHIILKRSSFPRVIQEHVSSVSHVL